jgi:hypothetical protein
MIDLSAISIVPEAFVLEVVAPERIVVINLDRRPDRWKAIRAAWPPEIASRFVRFAAIDGLRLPRERVDAYRRTRMVSPRRAAGELGCRDSWMRAVERHGPGLYFEDDARACLPWSYGLPPQDAHIVLLGGDAVQKVADPGWSRIRRGAWGTHAVWIRTDHAAELLVETWRAEATAHVPVDQAWEPVLLQTGAVIAVPQVVYQADIRTDVQVGRQLHPADTTPFDPWCSLDSADRRA